MNLQITNPIYSTKMTTPIVSQGAHASSKDMPHEVFSLSPTLIEIQWRSCQNTN